MNKQKRTRLIMSILILIIGIVSSIFFSTLLHKLLSGETTNLSIPKLKDCVESFMSSRQHLKLFLYFIALSFLASIGFYFSNDKAYQSKLIKVTPMIYTPAVAGQNQHGSARWLTEKEKDQVFKSYVLIKNDKFIQSLMEENKKYINTSEGGKKTSD
ncbi:TRAG family protein [Alkaliphilus sp. MSJ-5]|uniref:TRAG family protein n=1 Tax=Alkaliphilus flagellatus TaxID=2841507 RepID=A0ABS6G411_9FIRM|nr:TRAG family protein [Alkaliphilus flagellatus]MBU5676909.1 TRAG family protein [Alkaliphilus flagellatus]